MPERVSRRDQVLAVLRAEPDRLQTSAAISVPLNCAPSQVRDCLKALLRRGEVEEIGIDLFRPWRSPAEQEVRTSITRHLRLWNDLQFTDLGVAEGLPHLRLSEAAALTHLNALADAGVLNRTRERWTWFDHD